MSGKSLRCRLGRHTGQADGGTLMFTCPRCGGSFWQPEDFTAVTRQADALIDRGLYDDALSLAERAIRERYAGRPAAPGDGGPDR